MEMHEAKKHLNWKAMFLLKLAKMMVLADLDRVLDQRRCLVRILSLVQWFYRSAFCHGGKSTWSQGIQQDCDIRNFDDVSDRLSSVCPGAVVHLGAKVSSAWLLNLNTMTLM